MIQEEIFTAIAGNATVSNLIGSKIYPLELPQGAAMSAVVYSIALDEAVNSMNGDSGLDIWRLTIRSWGSSYAAAHALAAAVRGALLSTAGFKVVTASQNDERDFETLNYAVVQEFLIWSTFDASEYTPGASVSGYDKIEFIIDGRGKVITAGASGHKVVPWDCTITKWEVVSSASGSIVVDIKKSTYAAFDTFSSIAGTEKPTLAAARKNTNLVLSSWTKSLSVGDRLQALVDSADINGVAVVTLYVTKT